MEQLDQFVLAENSATSPCQNAPKDDLLTLENVPGEGKEEKAPPKE
jgi:hypothetical protein